MTARFVTKGFGWINHAQIRKLAGLGAQRLDDYRSLRLNLGTRHAAGLAGCASRLSEKQTFGRGAREIRNRRDQENAKPCAGQPIKHIADGLDQGIGRQFAICGRDRDTPLRIETAILLPPRGNNCA